MVRIAATPSFLLAILLLQSTISTAAPRKLRVEPQPPSPANATAADITAVRDRIRAHQEHYATGRSANLDGVKVGVSRFFKAGVIVSMGRIRDRGVEQKVRVVSPFVGLELGGGVNVFRTSTTFFERKKGRIIPFAEPGIGYEAAPVAGVTGTLTPRGLTIGMGGGYHLAMSPNLHLQGNIIVRKGSAHPIVGMSWTRRAERVAAEALKAEGEGDHAYANKARRLLEKTEKKVKDDQLGL
jgi:hypothetical protein